MYEVHFPFSLSLFQADDINTSHPNFVGGQKAIELAKQRIRGSKVVLFPILNQKNMHESESGHYIY